MAKRPISLSRRSKSVAVLEARGNKCSPEIAAEAKVISLRRHSSITSLAIAGTINADQIAAAFRFRNAWLTSVEAKAVSIGFDEWRSPGPPSASQAEAKCQAEQILASARALVGAYAFSLLCRVCGEGHAINDLYGLRRARESHIDILKIHLGMLARLWKC